MPRKRPWEYVRAKWSPEDQIALAQFNGRMNKIGVSNPSKKGRKRVNPALATLSKAQDKPYWQAVREIANGIKVGNSSIENFGLQPITLATIAKRVAANKLFYAQLKKRNPFERPRDKFVFYSRAEHDEDLKYLEACRAVLRTYFLAGQDNQMRNQGGGVDGLAYKKLDDELMNQIAHNAKRLAACAAIIINAKKQKKSNINTPKQERSGHWRNVQTESQAQAFKLGGFKTRVIEAGRKKIHQVLVRPG
jgi:hypothetical protein